jgi:hypothetical protein
VGKESVGLGAGLEKSMKPSPIQIPLAEALKWRGDGDFFFEEKIDGVFFKYQVDDFEFASEVKGLDIFIFHLLSEKNCNARSLTLRENKKLLKEILKFYPKLTQPRYGSGAEFLEYIISHGGEGVVAKPWDTGYNEGWLKAKRMQNFLCRVISAPDQFKAVAIADAQTGESRGHVPVPNGKADKIRIGSVLKVNGMCLTKKGLIREPRLDTDTLTSWLVNK